MKVREAAWMQCWNIRAGSGPYFLEIMTYRFRGHSMGDPERYRKQEEVHKWQENDPIGIYRRISDFKKALPPKTNWITQEQLAETKLWKQWSLPRTSPEPAPEDLIRRYLRRIERSGRTTMAKITMREAISQALWEEMERDPKVFIMGEEVGVWGGTYAVTKGFYDHFGAERVRDTPIAEAAIIGGAIGAALTGLRPVAELMTINFAFSAMDHIVNEAAKLHYMFGGQFVLPLVIRAVGGGGRQLGATHSQTPDAIFAHFPGLESGCPGNTCGCQRIVESSHSLQ